METDIVRKLAAKAKHGNVDAYGKLMEYYKEYLYKTAMLSVKNEQVALDCKWYNKTITFRQLKTDTFQVEIPAII